MPQPTMKWHNFLVKFGLPLGAVFSIAAAVLAISGQQYDMQGLSSAYVYRYYKGLQVLDIIYGLCLALCGVYAWMTRTALKNFRRTAPSMVQVSYIINLATTLVYTVAGMMLMNTSVDFSSLAPTVVGCIAGIGLHKTYYGKRAFMFTN